MMKEIKTDPNCNADNIKHEGIIRNMDPDFYFVSILTRSACDTCHSSAVCNIGNLKEETVEVPRLAGFSYNIGDRVEIVIHKKLGTKAVLYGYFYPFLLLIATLIIATSILPEEGLAALIAIAVLIPYYLILAGRKKQLKKTFTFRIAQ